MGGIYLVCDSSRFKTIKCLKLYLYGMVWFSLFFSPFLLFSCQNCCVIILQNTTKCGQDEF